MRVPGTRPARCLFRLSVAKVVFFHYTANDLQLFFIVSCIFFVFPSLGVLCRGCFLVFFFVFSLHPCGLPLIIYICTRTRAGAPWVAGADHPPRAGVVPSVGADGGPPPASGLVPLEAGTVQERGRHHRRAAGGGSTAAGSQLVRGGGSHPSGGRGARSMGGALPGARWVERSSRAAGVVVLVVAPVVEGVPGEGPGHICGPNGPRCRHRARSVAAALACEMGVFCGEVRLKISVLGVFLAVEWGSKLDWCEDLLIFFRKWLGDMRCFFVYYARGENNRDNVMEIHCFWWGMRGQFSSL